MILPQRKSIRLKDYDYSSAGYYFITICTFNKHHAFGSFQSGSLILNECGQIASENLQQISDHFPYAYNDVYVTMPNHIHMVLVVLENDHAVSKSSTTQNQISSMIVPKVIQQYKASVTSATRHPGLWHRGFYEHIIRNEQDYSRIWEYIKNNPSKWGEDEYFS